MAHELGGLLEAVLEKRAAHDRDPAVGALHGIMVGSVGGIGGAAIGATVHRAFGGRGLKHTTVTTGKSGLTRTILRKTAPTGGRMAALALGGLAGAYAMRSVLKEKNEPWRHGTTIGSAVAAPGLALPGLMGALGYSGRTDRPEWSNESPKRKKG